MKFVSLAGALCLAGSLSACATVTRGTQQKFSIVSEPPGADVKLSTGMTCVTPCQLKLRRKDDFVAHISKAGYAPVDIPVESKMHGGGGAALAGNLVAGGLIGGVIDGTNGSLRDLRPNPLEVKLVAAEAAAAAVQAEPAAPMTVAAEAPAAGAAPAGAAGPKD